MPFRVSKLYCAQTDFPDFGVYVDLSGHLSRGATTIEWQGKAENVAMHAPYMLLFNKYLIEVRHLESGQPIHFIVGNNIRCTWDRRTSGLQLPLLPPSDDVWDESVERTSQVHVVVDVESDSSSSVHSDDTSRLYSQAVCELLPI